MRRATGTCAISITPGESVRSFVPHPLPSVDWLWCSAIRNEALLTSQIEGTQARLTELLWTIHGRC